MHELTFDRIDENNSFKEIEPNLMEYSKQTTSDQSQYDNGEHGVLLNSNDDE